MNNSNNQKIGLCLSGGYDSGAISCCLNKNKLKYVSYTMKCKENMKIVNKRLKLNKNKYFYDINQEIYNKFKKLYQEEVEMTSIKRFSKPNKILNYYNLKGDWAGVGLYYIFSKSKKIMLRFFYLDKVLMKYFLIMVGKEEYKICKKTRFITKFFSRKIS